MSNVALNCTRFVSGSGNLSEKWETRLFLKPLTKKKNKVIGEVIISAAFKPVWDV